MKKLLAVAVVLVTACSKQATEPGGGTIDNPVPLAVGNYWAYLNYSTLGSDTTRDTLRIVGTGRVNGHEAFAVLWDDENDTSYVYRDGDYIYIFDQDGSQEGILIRFVKVPLSEGDTWTVYSESDSSDVITATVTGMVDIVVPAGRFEQAAEVRWMEIRTHATYADTSYEYYYFANDVGMVKYRELHGMAEEISELEGYDVR